MPSVQPFHANYRCDRREQVQGGTNKSPDKNFFTVAKVAKRIEQVEASIARYLAVFGPCRPGRTAAIWPRQRQSALKEKIEEACGAWQMQSLREIGKQVEAAPDKQVSLTVDPRCPLDGD